MERASRPMDNLGNLSGIDDSAPREGVSRQGASFARTGKRVLFGMFGYLLLVAAIVGWERHTLYQSVMDLEAIHAQEEDQHALNYAVSHAVLSINENYLAEDLAVAARLLTLEIDGVISKLARTQELYGGELTVHATALGRLNEELRRAPARATVAELREQFHQLVLRLDSLTTSIRARKAEVLEGYRDVFARLTIDLLALMGVAIVVVGGVSSIFFRQLTRDIGLVKQRATEVVRGYRGAPLAITRDDELGSLMVAVNEMEAELRLRDSQLELSRQQHFHTEKMAAVGSLAAAVAHEINNPLAAIVGLAESLVVERKLADDHPARSGDHQIDLILQQARRVMAITRQISEFSLQRPLVPAYVDLNAVVKSTCSFISFDKRFRGVSLEMDLGTDLPALFVVSDHLVQILMNLLINAADAIESGESDRAHYIRVRTWRSGRNRLVLSVEDNGSGIAKENIGRVFDPHFTTKPPGRGSGLGLSLCRSLLKEAGGEIAVESEAGRGTIVQVSLPVPDDVAN